MALERVERIGDWVRGAEENFKLLLANVHGSHAFIAGIPGFLQKFLLNVNVFWND
jgi:hypothetical protein